MAWEKAALGTRPSPRGGPVRGLSERVEWMAGLYPHGAGGDRAGAGDKGELRERVQQSNDSFPWTDQHRTLGGDIDGDRTALRQTWTAPFGVDCDD